MTVIVAHTQTFPMVINMPDMPQEQIDQLKQEIESGNALDYIWVFDRPDHQSNRFCTRDIYGIELSLP